MSSTLALPKEISLYSEEFQGDYNFANMQQVLSQVAEQIHKKLESENKGVRKKNLFRTELGLRRLLHDFGEELTNISTNPLFSDAKVVPILQETQNFSPEELEDFFQNLVIEKDIQELYTTKLPIEFDLLAGLDDEQLEFVKQRCLRGLGKDSKSDMRRAFLLQMMKYLEYGYDKSLQGSENPILGVNYREFATDISTEHSDIMQQMRGKKPVGDSYIMQFIDAIYFFNHRENLDGFERCEQSVRGRGKVALSIDNSGAIETFARRYRANKLSQEGKKIFITPFSNINDESLYTIYTSLTAYIGQDYGKIKRILNYIADYLGCKFGQGEIGFDHGQLAQNTGIKRKSFNGALWDSPKFILRALVAVSDSNNGRGEFSKEVFKDVYRKVEEGERV